MEITINAIELAAELAEERLQSDWSELIPIYENEKADILTYTDEAQDIFNEWYDFYLTKIEECNTNQL
jgi:hypothetical protein